MTEMTENQELNQENDIQAEEAVMAEAAAPETTEAVEVPEPKPLPEHPGLNIGNERLELLLDIPLNISVELGRNKMSIQELYSFPLGQPSSWTKVPVTLWTSW